MSGIWKLIGLTESLLCMRTLKNNPILISSEIKINESTKLSSLRTCNILQYFSRRTTIYEIPRYKKHTQFHQ
uniref:Uncharacterized protein n=1 Tax=Lepeophtheirus salmonis TaxID=72036 RepID=A0A0K2TG53_LEPSM